MKIPDGHAAYSNDKDRIQCPGCHCSRCRKHGFYTRKGFHAPNHAVALPCKVQRYCCCNPECPRRTFSVLPPLVMRYCRFFWPYLLAIKHALASGLTLYHLARCVWHVGRAVIQRAAALLHNLSPWVEQLHQELTDGKPERELGLMVKIISAKIGRCELVQRWYRHRHPLRFC